MPARCGRRRGAVGEPGPGPRRNAGGAEAAGGRIRFPACARRGSAGHGPARPESTGPAPRKSPARECGAGPAPWRWRPPSPGAARSGRGRQRRPAGPARRAPPGPAARPRRAGSRRRRPPIGAWPGECPRCAGRTDGPGRTSPGRSAPPGPGSGRGPAGTPRPRAGPTARSAPAVCPGPGSAAWQAGPGGGDEDRQRRGRGSRAENPLDAEEVVQAVAQPATSHRRRGGQPAAQLAQQLGRLASRLLAGLGEQAGAGGPFQNSQAVGVGQGAAQKLQQGLSAGGAPARRAVSRQLRRRSTPAAGGRPGRGGGWRCRRGPVRRPAAVPSPGRPRSGRFQRNGGLRPPGRKGNAGTPPRHGRSAGRIGRGVSPA